MKKECAPNLVESVFRDNLSASANAELLAQLLVSLETGKVPFAQNQLLRFSGLPGVDGELSTG